MALGKDYAEERTKKCIYFSLRGPVMTLWELTSVDDESFTLLWKGGRDEWDEACMYEEALILYVCKEPRHRGKKKKKKKKSRLGPYMYDIVLYCTLCMKETNK